jgi:hypothetical protein
MLKKMVVFWMVSFLGMACGEDTHADSLLGEEVSSEGAELSVREGEGSAFYYTLRRDMRRCATPMCGGYFIRRVNRRALRCMDGVRRSECYVASLDVDALALDDAAKDAFIHNVEHHVALGVVEPFNGAPRFSERFGQLKVQKAWTNPEILPAEHQPLYWVQNLHIVCITTPCFSYAVQRLGLDGRVEVSEIRADDESVFEILASQDVLASGRVFPVRSRQHARGRGFEISHVYTPVKPSVVDNALACDVDEDCVSTLYKGFVQNSEECYGPCPCNTAVVNVSTHEKNKQAWEMHCQAQDWVCPAVVCIPAPVPVCKEHVCVSPY